jgi:hypothetical protein
MKQEGAAGFGLKKKLIILSGANDYVTLIITERTRTYSSLFII